MEKIDDIFIFDDGVISKLRNIIEVADTEITSREYMLIVGE